MSRFKLTLALLVVGVSSPWAARADEDEVRGAIAAYGEAFNKQDLEAVGAMWAEHATYSDHETGERTEGRKAILADITESVQERPAKKLVVKVERVRLIKPDVASVEGQTSLEASGEEPIRSEFSAVLVNENGKWVFDSVQDRGVATPETAFDALHDLAWFEGHWVDDSDEARVDTTVSWTADGAFMLRSFLAQTSDGEMQQGTQIIGWDPRSREIRSWTFNSDGSFGDGIWSRSGDSWLIKSSQTLSDGRAASGTYVMTRVENDALKLQLIGHEVEGEPQPTGEAVTMVRAPEVKKSAASAAPSSEKPVEGAAP